MSIFFNKIKVNFIQNLNSNLDKTSNNIDIYLEFNTIYFFPPFTRKYGSSKQPLPGIEAFIIISPIESHDTHDNNLIKLVNEVCR